MSEPASGFDAETRARIDCAEQFDETGTHLPDCPRAHHQQAEKLLELTATVAALTAENERLRSLFDAEDAKALDEYAEDEARSVGSHLHHLAARIRAALPSSRETDG